MPDSSARWTQAELRSFSPEVNLAISPLCQEEFLKWLPDPSTYARNHHHLSDFPGFTQITDQIHGSWIRTSPYPTKEPGETEEMTSSHPHRQVLRYEDRNGTREICSAPIVLWETYLCYGTTVTTLVWFCSFSTAFPQDVPQCLAKLPRTQDEERRSTARSNKE